MRCTGPLALLGAYLLLLALACRLAELVARLRRGDAGKRVDPARLDAATLRRILRTRGLQCRGCAERRDLAALVNTSGWATVGELDALASTDRTPAPVQLAHAHALAEIEEDRDDVWLMRVLPATKRHGDKEWPTGAWQELQLRVSPLLVRVCELDCSRLPAECARRGWTQSAVLLRLPAAATRGWRARVPAAAERLFAWIGKELADSVAVVKDCEEVARDWLTEGSVSLSSGGMAPLRVLLLTRLLTPPLFIAALAARLKGRVAFATFTVRDSVCRRRLRSRGLDVRLGDVTLVATPEGVVKYGARRGELPAAAPLARVLRAALPQPSDLMVVSLALVNMLAALQASQVCESRWWRLVARCVWTTVRCNLCLLAAWLAVLALCRFSLANRLADSCMSLARRMALSQVGAELRADWQWLDVWTVLATLAVFAWLARMRCRPVEPLGEPQRLWWEVLPDGAWADCFFRARRPPPTEGVEGEEEREPELEEGVELLIERLAVPSLWLRPAPAHDYVRHLPVWRHRGWRHAGGGKADVERRLIESLMDGHESPPLTPKPPPSPCAAPSADPNPTRDDIDSTTDTMDSESDDGVAVRAPAHARHTTECAVCLESFAWRAALCGLPCGHSFHRRCIGAWLMRDHHHCPVCRWPAYKPKPAAAVGVH